MSLKTRNFRLVDEVSEINKSYLDKAKALHDKLLGGPKVWLCFVLKLLCPFLVWFVDSRSRAKSATGIQIATIAAGTTARTGTTASATRAAPGKATSLSRARERAKGPSALSARAEGTLPKIVQAKARAKGESEKSPVRRIALF